MRRDDIVTGSLHHIADSWLRVAHLEGFIFFASAQSVTRGIEDIINHQPDEPYRKLRFVAMTAMPRITIPSGPPPQSVAYDPYPKVPARLHPT